MGPVAFLGNPNFKLAKNVGKAYLFEVNENIDSSLIFMDDFEYNDLNTNGWLASASSNEGLGYANITTELSHNGVHSLKIVAKSLDKEFWYSVQRMIYVPSANNVTLSFYVNATRGYDNWDTLMIIVSDQSWTKQLFFTTNSNYSGPSLIVLPTSQGVCQFNLSEIWKKVYSSAQPTSFYFQVLNYDSDGVENMAYLDSISLQIGS